MSLENYSEELRNFLNNHTKLINDDSFHQKLEMQNVSIIEEYIRKEMSFPEIKCLFFYLSALIQNDSFRNTIISNINKKFLEQRIKAREIPDIHYIVVFKISEEEYLNKNINIIKQFFEDYLIQLKEVLEYEEIKKKMEEEARLEEIKEQEKRERFILPKINTCEIIDINKDSITINVPLYDEYEIINKNKYTIKNCIEKYSKTQIQYIIYLYKREKNKYFMHIIPKKIEDIDVKKNKYKITIKESLKPNQIYLFLLGVKFADNYSNPTSHKFYIMTNSNQKYGKLVIYGDKKNKNNFVDIDDNTKIVLPKGIKNYKDCFKNNITIFPLLYNNNVEDISISDKRASCIIGNGKVIESGLTINVQPGDYFEGSFPEDSIIKKDDPSLIIEYINSTPFLLKFPNQIKIRKICVGVGHCLALSIKGECFSWGVNDFGQLGLGKETKQIIGNPTKIKFDIYDSDGHKYITELEPLFYDIAAGNYSSLSLGIFNNKQILYYFGNGAGSLNDDSTQIIQSIYPKPIIGLENITKIFARFNSIGIFCYDKGKNFNTIYIHGTQKFGIDAGFGIYNRPKPIIVNFFRDNNIDVLSVNFSLTCMSVIGKNLNNNKIEIYLRGELCKRLFEFKEYQINFMKLEKDWAENVISISPQEKILFLLLKNGVVKKLWKDGNKFNEEDIKIEKYDLKDLNVNEIKKVKFFTFLNDNFVIFYQSK
jgi:hypothetical protein